MIYYSWFIHLSWHIAVHYLGYAVHETFLYGNGSDQSQQSLFIAYWIPSGYTYVFLNASCLKIDKVSIMVERSNSLVSQAVLWTWRLMDPIPKRYHCEFFFLLITPMLWDGNLQDFHPVEKEMARIYRPNQQIRNAKFSTFWHSSTERSKFLESTLYHLQNSIPNQKSEGEI